MPYAVGKSAELAIMMAIIMLQERREGKSREDGIMRGLTSQTSHRVLSM